MTLKRKLIVAISVLMLVFSTWACNLPAENLPTQVPTQVPGILPTVSVNADAKPVTQQGEKEGDLGSVEGENLPSGQAQAQYGNAQQFEGSTQPFWATYMTEWKGGAYNHGPYDSNIVLAQWNGAGVTLAWAVDKQFVNGQVDFVYEKYWTSETEYIDNCFINVHAGEATLEQVQDLVTTLQAGDLIWVYVKDQVEYMSRSQSSDASFVFNRFQVYRDHIEIPEILHAPWE